MAYPTDLNPTLKTNWANTTPVEDTHPNEHNYVGSAVEALKAKVGIDGSAVTTSHDYKLSTIIGSAKAVSDTSGTLTTPKIVTSINDANGNEVIKTPATTSAVNEITVTNSATGNAVGISATGGDTNIDLSITAKGSGNVKLGTAGIKFPNSDGSSGYVLQTDGSGNMSFQSIPTSPQDFIAFAQWSSGARCSDSHYSDSSSHRFAKNGTTFYISTSGVMGVQVRNTTSDWASSDAVKGITIIGIYTYVLLRDVSNNYRVYRYTTTSLSSGGTLMTISGQAFATTGGGDVNMTSNGTNFYFTNKAGNSANNYVISKYTISGTTLTYSSDITCGSTANSTKRIAVTSNETIYGLSSADNKIRQFNSSGTLVATSDAFGVNEGLTNLASSYYMECNFTSGWGIQRVIL